MGSVHVEPVFQPILTALENLNRRLTDLLQDIAEGRIQSMGVIDFNKAALNMAWNPPAMELLMSVFNQTAPFDLTVSLPAPHDFRGILDKQRADSSPRSLVYDSSEEESTESLMLQRFLTHFGPVYAGIVCRPDPCHWEKLSVMVGIGLIAMARYRISCLSLSICLLILSSYDPICLWLLIQEASKFN